MRQTLTEVKCEAFGDESSANNRYAIYSFIGFSPKGVEAATSVLADVKEQFGVPNSARFHCRVLFSGDQRAKTEWNQLDPKDTAEFCRKLSSGLLHLTPLWSYGYVDFFHLQKLPSPNLMSGKFSTDIGREFSMRFGIKEAQKFAYAAAEAPIVLRFNDSARFWIDQEESKIDWFFNKKKAHNIHSGLGAPAKIVLPKEYEPMLEIADLFAYTASRHLSDRQQFGQQVFRTIHKQFCPIASKMTLDPSLFGSEVSTKEWLQAAKY
jgi:hypothetical protein